MSEDRVAQGKQKSMPYTSVLELLGERFHSEQDFLRRLNPGQNMGALAVGSRVKVPAVADPLYVNHLAGHGHLIAARPEFRPRVVMVYTKEKVLDVLEDGQLLASFPITPGSTTLPAPPGTWKIENMASMPYFRYDESMLEHGVRSDNFVNLPPGPNSPVGVMWMGLNKSGIGLHGTNNPETIGRAASHGCIRLANWDAVKLSQMVTTGTTVHIDGEGKPPAPGARRRENVRRGRAATSRGASRQRDARRAKPRRRRMRIEEHPVRQRKLPSVAQVGLAVPASRGSRAGV